MLTHNLEIYLVGGAVRDRLIIEQRGEPDSLREKDREWVVVGATVEELLDLGFVQVGKDFPVFLHPETKEEYALARTERKLGSGHVGFAVDANPSVTLLEDLSRRDLTINAIAQAQDGGLIDPSGGQQDIAEGWLRHVSPAFIEDPLRVFRVARFAAQLPGFQVAPETHQLMQQMCAQGELATLSPERVWQELSKALGGPMPQRFFEVLDACGGLVQWLPEFQGVVSELMFDSRPEPIIRLAKLPLSEQALMTLVQRLRGPKSYIQLIEDRFGHLSLLQSWPNIEAKALHATLMQLRALQDHRRLVALVGLMDLAEQRLQLEQQLLPLCASLKAIRLSADEQARLQGAEFGQALNRQRQSHIGEVLARLQRQ